MPARVPSSNCSSASLVRGAPPAPIRAESDRPRSLARIGADPLVPRAFWVGGCPRLELSRQKNRLPQVGSSVSTTHQLSIQEMSRNAQVVRQWLLLERLERSKGATLDQLVESLPADSARHPRTVRRDLEALEARFPLVTERREGKTVWRLMDGYNRSLTLAFSQTELMALVFSRDLLKPLDGTELKSSLDSAFNKMVAALPSDGAGFIGHLCDFFSVGLGPHKKYKDHRRTIECLTRAISQSRSVQMRYYAASRNVTSRRNVDPYRLWYAQGGLNTSGAPLSCMKDVSAFMRTRPH